MGIKLSLNRPTSVSQRTVNIWVTFSLWHSTICRVDEVSFDNMSETRTSVRYRAGYNGLYYRYYRYLLLVVVVIFLLLLLLLLCCCLLLLL